MPENIFGKDLLCANADAARLLHLQEALLNQESKAVWCLKGGYGCARLIPELIKLMPPEKAKLFIGFSDITVLHLFLQQQWCWQTLHGPGITQLGLESIEQSHIQEAKDVIFGKQTLLNFQLKPLNKAARQTINIQTTITGGTLSLIQTSIGTLWQCDSKNKILFLEDVNERGYKVDRMLLHLKQAGIFSDVTAIIFGDFIEGKEPTGISLIEPVLQRFAEENDFPMLYSPEIGHGKFNRPLPFGVPANLQLGEASSLVVRIN